MEKLSLSSPKGSKKWDNSRLFIVYLIPLFLIFYVSHWMVFSESEVNRKFSKEEKRTIRQRCASLQALPVGFDASKRTQSDRFDLGTRSTLLRNGKVRKALRQQMLS